MHKSYKYIRRFLHKGDNRTMKTYTTLMEGKRKRWADIKDKATKREASGFLKALDKGQLLGYSVEHQEFSIFETEKDFTDAQKGKGKSMQWIKVEKWIRHGIAMNEAYKPGDFNFKGAVKTGMLDKYDEAYIISLKKKGWMVYEFLLTSKGFELTVVDKSGKKKMFTDKTPEAALKQADKKLK